ncbi:hypothetical protein JVU11DRAFT_2271 [Chiua virens]|nr:hypothetical protein JVU11DRAFT_2271 [Chiua virens]
MHHALQLDEILLHVFSYCHSHCVKTQNVGRRGDCFSTAELAALARTCRTFKEPALNVLWLELTDLSPLARCLPGVCYQITRGYKVRRF